MNKSNDENQEILIWGLNKSDIENLVINSKEININDILLNLFDFLTQNLSFEEEFIYVLYSVV